MYELSNELNIENMIYEIRGKQIILDYNLAKLYQCANGTKTINQAVKRNIERFPEDFYFQLTNEDLKILRSQIGTLELKQGQYSKYLPYAFTEQGTAMLATVIRTKIAAETSIKIMRAFVAMRKYISTNLIEQRYINELVLKDNKRIDLLEETFAKFEDKELVNEIFFEGQIYEAYSKILDILMKAKENIIIIDAYADKFVLDMISKVKIPVTLILSSKSRLSELDIDKYNKEYTNLTLIYNDTFHDRYIILDKNIVYHLGTSLNNAGTKTFGVNRITEEEMIKALITKIESIIY